MVEGGFDVFDNLFCGFEVMIVDTIVVEFAGIGGIVATDLRPRFVDAAAIVAAKMFAYGMHQQVPILIFDKHRSPIVQ